jgi:hypothetical protein
MEAVRGTPFTRSRARRDGLGVLGGGHHPHPHEAAVGVDVAENRGDPAAAPEARYASSSNSATSFARPCESARSFCTSALRFFGGAVAMRSRTWSIDASSFSPFAA